MATPETDETEPEAETATHAQAQGKDVVSRLADRGEEALQRLAELPGGKRALQAFTDLRARVDEMSKKVRGIDALEARVAKLEKELAALKRASKAKTPTRKT
jgi:polyhydroxyalkanoate synthesis regulator phasin